MNFMAITSPWVGQLDQMRYYTWGTCFNCLNRVFPVGVRKKNPSKGIRIRFVMATTVSTATPKSDQFQISPAASEEILHHTVWRTWLFIPYSDERRLCYQFLTTLLIYFSFKGWENVLFELGSERLKYKWSEQCSLAGNDRNGKDGTLFHFFFSSAPVLQSCQGSQLHVLLDSILWRMLGKQRPRLHRVRTIKPVLERSRQGMGQQCLQDVVVCHHKAKWLHQLLLSVSIPYL